ncbi:MAG: murein L,D-transpeptidase catalytic domain-containing protein [Sphingorhabdus sp.]
MLKCMGLFRMFAGALVLVGTSTAFAQDTLPSPLPPAQPPIIFTPGTGNGTPINSVPIRPSFPCAGLDETKNRFAALYPTPLLPTLAELSSTPSEIIHPSHRLDQTLLDQALASYVRYHCSYGRTSGPAIIVVVDFAKKSNEPRLYRIDLRTGQGIDDPIRVAHGIGSDWNDDGAADAFGNTQDSLMSSLGPARGGEIYTGINGRSLRLDGLEASNSAMRARDIVVHSYSPSLLRYFNGELLMMRGGRPGTSEGCFVVEPDKRDWIMQTLVDGGFLYSGYSGVLPQPAVPRTSTGQQVIFVPGQGGG